MSNQKKTQESPLVLVVTTAFLWGREEREEMAPIVFCLSIPSPPAPLLNLLCRLIWSPSRAVTAQGATGWAKWSCASSGADVPPSNQTEFLQSRSLQHPEKAGCQKTKLTVSLSHTPSLWGASAPRKLAITKTPTWVSVACSTLLWVKKGTANPVTCWPGESHPRLRRIHSTHLRRKDHSACYGSNNATKKASLSLMSEDWYHQGLPRGHIKLW